MIFLDINTFYSPKSGGIRTYHHAKIDWFKDQDRRVSADVKNITTSSFIKSLSEVHQYYLVYPGPKQSFEKINDNITLVQTYGLAVTSDPSGYRIILDYLRILFLIQKIKPDVIEAGDPWLTGLFCLILKKSGYFKGLLVSFYHSDPVPSYLEPWSKKGGGQFFKKRLVQFFAKSFYTLQKGYDVTSVASKAMAQRLISNRVSSVAYLPFGVPELFFSAGKKLPRSGQQIKLLYAGRLDKEKGIELILSLIPKIIGNEKLELTVVGRGAFGAKFSEINHPRIHFLGFINSVEKILEIYDANDIMLAPGPYETFGLGVLEAMARGMIVIGPDLGGTAELLQQLPKAYIFKANDLQDFEKIMDQALFEFDSALYPHSKKLAAEYGTWNDAIGRMITTYTQILKSTSPSRITQ